MADAEEVKDAEGVEGEGAQGGEAEDFEDEAEGQQLGGDITDISNAPAVKYLEKLVTTGQLTEQRMERLKSKYEKLYHMVLKIFDSERTLLQKARTLNKEVTNDQNKFKKFTESQKQEKDELESLRAEMAKADAERQVVEEQVMIKTLEQAELRRQLKEADDDRRRMEQERMQMLEPKLNALKEEISGLEGEIAMFDQKHQKTCEEKDELNKMIKERTADVDGAKREVNRLNLLLDKTKNDPDKLSRQAGVVESAVNGLKQDLEEQSDALEQLKDDVAQHEQKRLQLEDQLKTLKNRYDKFSTVVEQRMLALQDQKHEIQLKEMKKQQLENKLNEADDSLKECHRTRKATEDELQKYKREEQDWQRQEVAKSGRLQSIQNLIVPYRMQEEDLNFELKDGEDFHNKLKAEVEEMRKEVDILIHQFLIAEKLSQDEHDQVKSLDDDRKKNEEILKGIKDTYKDLKDQIAKLTAERELMSRKCSQQLLLAKGATDELRMRDILIADLKRQQKLTKSKLTEFNAKYEVVKNQRNKAVEQIQETTQQLAELRDKIKILENEVEILENDNQSKDARYAKVKKELEKATLERDTHARDLNELNFDKKKKMEVITHRVAEIAKLNHVIDKAEKEMVNMKKKYEMTMEERNFTGIQLIDRNDELCILYEKANIQEAILHSGQVELRKREQEIRMLHINLADLARHKEVKLKLRDTVPGFEAEIKKLNLELKSEREEGEKLSKALVTPNNESRWRWVRQEPPDPDELRDKIRLLDERLNDKQEQLLEKELVLEEVTNLSSRLRETANEGREDTLTLAKQVNEYQSKIRAKTLKMMATVSELSMYQASSMKLEQEKDELDDLVKTAQERLAAGEPPVEGIEDEWARMEYRRMKAEEDAWQRQQHAEQSNGMVQQSQTAVHVTRTTAEPRPNAYIPDEIGIPKPYGAAAPFKPSEPGSSMRHVRKPQPQEIQI